MLMFHIKGELNLTIKMFVGYDGSSKGYKLYNPNNNKVVVSRDVEFNEAATWNWEAQEERTYDFLPFGYEEEQEIMTPTQDATPTSFTGKYCISI